MGSGLIDGAILMGVGIAVVFASLVILMAVITLLGRVFPEKGQVPAPGGKKMESIVSQGGESPPEGEVVAAIGLALSLAQLESARSVSRGGASRKPSPWVAYGRQQLMDLRGRTRKQW